MAGAASTGPMSVDEVAAAMRVAGGDRRRSQELLASLFADQVAIRHVPPAPTDSLVPRDVIVDISAREVAALARAMPDAEHGDADVTVEGDAVRVRSRTSGTLRDGTPIDVLTNTSFTVADGRIVALQSEMDAASADAWRTVLAAGEPGTP
jgi:ketosteroid isomerase-like protein